LRTPQAQTPATAAPPHAWVARPPGNDQTLRAISQRKREPTTADVAAPTWLGQTAGAAARKAAKERRFDP